LEVRFRFFHTIRGHAFLTAALDCLVQPLHEDLIVAVGGHVGRNAAFNGEAEEIEVADKVQDLVAHELVGITELRIDDLAVVHDDMGMEIPAADLSKLLAISMFSKVLKERAGAMSARKIRPRLNVRTCSPMGRG